MGKKSKQTKRSGKSLEEKIFQIFFNILFHLII